MQPTGAKPNSGHPKLTTEKAARAKRQEEELDEAKSRLPNVQRDLSEHQKQVDSLRTRAEEAEHALAQTQVELDKQRLALREEISDKASLDRRPWLEDVGLRSTSRPESPLLSPPPRTLSNDALGLQGFSTRFRKASAPSSNGDPGSNERSPSARRPSQQPPRPSNISLSSGQFDAPTSILEGESIIAASPHPLERPQLLERGSTFDSFETPVSSHNVLQDMVSVSTIAAGPSVQLVERMSAAIRRLESEKVAAKDELARISSQRDEARGEIVMLMKEAEAGRTAAQKVEELEKEVTQINERYQTTLEMLGEKSELVEELRADVQDVKAMYRDLVERTIR
jgi:TATA element modulatory factor